MQRVLTCWLLAVAVRGTVAAAQNGRDHGYAKEDSSPTLHRRVVGGEEISNEELGGYIVAMLYKNSFACGGTLIQDRIVLSAAHCFYPRAENKQWLIIGGISSLNETGLRSKVTDVILSPDFRPDDLHSDVAVVLLDKPLVGENIAKLPLCSTPLQVGNQLVVAGWGVIQEGSSKHENKLRSVTVTYMDHNECTERYDSTEAKVTDTMLCAGVLGSKDACLFDSGGPLVYNNEICGIVSFGIGCAHVKYPGVYADVTKMKPFIEQSIKLLCQGVK